MSFVNSILQKKIMESREQELDQEMLEKLAADFTKLQEYPLNPFANAEKIAQSNEITAADWESCMEEPCYTAYFLEALEAGNYTTRKGVLEDFNLFISRAIEATNNLDSSNPYSPGVLYKSLLETIKQEYSKKILKATFLPEELFIHKANKQIEQIEELFKLDNFSFNENDILETTIFTNDHEIPKKLDVV